MSAVCAAISDRLLASTRISHPPSPVGEAGTGRVSLRVLGTKDLLDKGQQSRVLVAGSSSVPCLTSPAGEVGSIAQGVRVLKSLDPCTNG